MRKVSKLTKSRTVISTRSECIKVVLLAISPLNSFIKYVFPRLLCSGIFEQCFVLQHKVSYFGYCQIHLNVNRYPFFYPVGSVARSFFSSFLLVFPPAELSTEAICEFIFAARSRTRLYNQALCNELSSYRLRDRSFCRLPFHAISVATATILPGQQFHLCSCFH